MVPNCFRGARKQSAHGWRSAKKAMSLRRNILLSLGCLSIPAISLANVSVPGPIVWQGAYMGAESIVRYIASVGLICIGLEGAIYHYLSRYKHPYRDSIVSNVVSTILGIPLAILAVPFDDIFIIPTLASIVIEGGVICAMERRTRTEDGKSIFWPVVWANVLSNALIFALIVRNMET